MACSRNHCCSLNAKILSLCCRQIIGLHVAVSNVTDIESVAWKQRKSFLVLLSFICRCQQCETHLGLPVKCPTFLSSLNKIWLLWTDIRESLQYQISSKSVQWKPHWYMRTDARTDGQEETNRCFLDTRCAKKYLFSKVTCSLIELFINQLMHNI